MCSADKSHLVGENTARRGEGAGGGGGKLRVAQWLHAPQPAVFFEPRLSRHQGALLPEWFVRPKFDGEPLSVCAMTSLLPCQREEGCLWSITPALSVPVLPRPRDRSRVCREPCEGAASQGRRQGDGVTHVGPCPPAAGRANPSQ